VVQARSRTASTLKHGFTAKVHRGFSDALFMVRFHFLKTWLGQKDVLYITHIRSAVVFEDTYVRTVCNFKTTIRVKCHPKIFNRMIPASRRCPFHEQLLVVVQAGSKLYTIETPETKYVSPKRPTDFCKPRK
jgi:hypothetical protein